MIIVTHAREFGTIQIVEYKLEFIPGTVRWVLSELKEKHPSVSSIFESTNLLTFYSLENINAFTDLFSGLRITCAGEKNSLNLYRRKWRKEFVPAGVNPAFAYVMCEVAEINKTDVVLDPFCGGGTIPITAALYFHPKQVIASDISGTAIDITEKNLVRSGIKNIMVFRSNVSKLKLGEKSISKIITNLPFGIREKTHDKNIEIYRNFAQISGKILARDGRIVALTQEVHLFQGIFNKFGFVKVVDYPIEQGGLKPHIFVYR